MSVIVKGGGGKSSGLYVWAKYNADIGLGESINNIALANDGTSIDIYVKENLYIKEDGTIGVQGEPYSTVSISSVVEDTCIGGMTPTKYCIGVDGNVYSSPLSHIAGSVDNCVANLVKVVKSTFIDFVVSDSETAYPDGAVHTDGYWYELFDGSGAYVWKKCIPKTQLTLTNPTILLKGTTTSRPKIFDVVIDSNYSIDESFFDGFENGSRSFSYSNGTLKYYTYEVTYDSSTNQLTFSSAPITSGSNITIEYSGEKTVNLKNSISGDVVEHVVSDDSSAYPDGNVYGDYFYQKIVDGISGIDFGQITLTKTSGIITVFHCLRSTPSFVAIIPKTLHAGNTNSGTQTNINGMALCGSDLSVVSAKVFVDFSLITFYSSSTSTFEIGDYYWIAIA